jgi:hypothetical protein
MKSDIQDIDSHPLPVLNDTTLDNSISTSGMSSMSFLYKIIILGVLSYMIDILTSPQEYYNKCINNHNFHTKLMIHHIMVIFIFFGWLSNNKYILYIYVFIPIVLLVHWKQNNNRCVLTETVNTMCGLDKDDHIRDFIYFLGIKKTKYYDPLYKTFLVLIFFFVIFKIFKILS